MAKQISPRVSFVGKVDWQLKSFHGHELSTHRGSSYNAYLVRGDEKTVLLDTVWKPYDGEFVSRLAASGALASLDAIVMNHNEIDHSGSLPALMEAKPGLPIYCTKKGEAFIRAQFHRDWDFHPVKTGDVLELGGCKLTFIEATMLHWPDTMFSYLDADGGILFSNDGFGQHYASESLFDDEEDLDKVLAEAEKYYANILAPYSPMVARKVKEILSMNLPTALICPSHGVIWRKNQQAIIDRYLAWSGNYQTDQVTVFYDTMWNSTRLMAEAIAEGIREASPSTRVVLMNASLDDKNDIATEIFRSKAVLAGSPTVNRGCLYAVAGMLELLKGLGFKGKKAAAFGSYGWGGESVKLVGEELAKAGFALVDEGLKLPWVPDEAMKETAREYGRAFARAL